jgi:hypothetical protein
METLCLIIFCCAGIEPDRTCRKIHFAAVSGGSLLRYASYSGICRETVVCVRVGGPAAQTSG